MHQLVRDDRGHFVWRRAIDDVEDLGLRVVEPDDLFGQQDLISPARCIVSGMRPNSLYAGSLPSRSRLRVTRGELLIQECAHLRLRPRLDLRRPFELEAHRAFDPLRGVGDLRRGGPP